MNHLFLYRELDLALAEARSALKFIYKEIEDSKLNVQSEQLGERYDLAIRKVDLLIRNVGRILTQSKGITSGKRPTTDQFGRRGHIKGNALLVLDDLRSSRRMLEENKMLIGDFNSKEGIKMEKYVELNDEIASFKSKLQKLENVVEQPSDPGLQPVNSNTPDALDAISAICTLVVAALILKLKRSESRIANMTANKVAS